VLGTSQLETPGHSPRLYAGKATSVTVAGSGAAQFRGTVKAHSKTNTHWRHSHGTTNNNNKQRMLQPSEELMVVLNALGAGDQQASPVACDMNWTASSSKQAHSLSNSERKSSHPDELVDLMCAEDVDTVEGPLAFWQPPASNVRTQLAFRQTRGSARKEWDPIAGHAQPAAPTRTRRSTSSHVIRAGLSRSARLSGPVAHSSTRAPASTGAASARGRTTSEAPANLASTLPTPPTHSTPRPPLRAGAFHGGPRRISRHVDRPLAARLGIKQDSFNRASISDSLAHMLNGGTYVTGDDTGRQDPPVPPLPLEGEGVDLGGGGGAAGGAGATPSSSEDGQGQLSPAAIQTHLAPQLARTSSAGSLARSADTSLGPSPYMYKPPPSSSFVPPCNVSVVSSSKGGTFGARDLDAVSGEDDRDSLASYGSNADSHISVEEEVSTSAQMVSDAKGRRRASSAASSHSEHEHTGFLGESGGEGWGQELVGGGSSTSLGGDNGLHHGQTASTLTVMSADLAGQTHSGAATALQRLQNTRIAQGADGTLNGTAELGGTAGGQSTLDSTLQQMRDLVPRALSRHDFVVVEPEYFPQGGRFTAPWYESMHMLAVKRKLQAAKEEQQTIFEELQRLEAEQQTSEIAEEFADRNESGISGGGVSPRYGGGGIQGSSLADEAAATLRQAEGIAARAVREQHQLRKAELEAAQNAPLQLPPPPVSAKKSHLMPYIKRPIGKRLQKLFGAFEAAVQRLRTSIEQGSGPKPGSTHGTGQQRSWGGATAGTQEALWTAPTHSDSTTDQWRVQKWMSVRHLQSIDVQTLQGNMAVLREWFVSLDSDHSGTIGMDELVIPLLSVGLARSEREVLLLIHAVKGTIPPPYKPEEDTTREEEAREAGVSVQRRFESHDTAAASAGLGPHKPSHDARAATHASSYLSLEEAKWDKGRGTPPATTERNGSKQEQEDVRQPHSHSVKLERAVVQGGSGRSYTRIAKSDPSAGAVVAITNESVAGLAAALAAAGQDSDEEGEGGVESPAEGEGGAISYSLKAPPSSSSLKAGSLGEVSEASLSSAASSSSLAALQHRAKGVHGGIKGEAQRLADSLYSKYGPQLTFPEFCALLCAPEVVGWAQQISAMEQLEASIRAARAGSVANVQGTASNPRLRFAATQGSSNTKGRRPGGRGSPRSDTGPPPSGSGGGGVGFGSGASRDGSVGMHSIQRADFLKKRAAKTYSVAHGAGNLASTFEARRRAGKGGKGESKAPHDESDDELDPYATETGIVDSSGATIPTIPPELRVPLPTVSNRQASIRVLGLVPLAPNVGMSAQEARRARTEADLDPRRLKRNLHLNSMHRGKPGSMVATNTQYRAKDAATERRIAEQLKANPIIRLFRDLSDGAMGDPGLSMATRVSAYRRRRILAANMGDQKGAKGATASMFKDTDDLGITQLAALAGVVQEPSAAATAPPPSSPSQGSRRDSRASSRGGTAGRSDSPGRAQTSALADRLHRGEIDKGSAGELSRGRRPRSRPVAALSSTFGPKSKLSEDERAAEAAQMVRNRRMSRFMRHSGMSSSKGGFRRGGSPVKTHRSSRGGSPSLHAGGDSANSHAVSATEGVLAATERTDAEHRLPPGIRTALRTAWVHHFAEEDKQGGARGLPTMPGVATGEHAVEHLTRGAVDIGERHKARAEKQVAKLGTASAEARLGKPAPTTAKKGSTSAPIASSQASTVGTLSPLGSQEAAPRGATAVELAAAQRDVAAAIRAEAVAPVDLTASAHEFAVVPKSTVRQVHTSELLHRASASTLGSRGGREGAHLKNLETDASAGSFNFETYASPGSKSGLGTSAVSRAAQVLSSAAQNVLMSPRGGGSGTPGGGSSQAPLMQSSLDDQGTSHASSFNLQRFVREREEGAGGVPAVPTLKKKPALRRKGAKGKNKGGRVRIAVDTGGEVSSRSGGDGGSSMGGSSAVLAALVGSASGSTTGGSRRSVDLTLFQDASSTEATAARAQLLANSSSLGRA